MQLTRVDVRSLIDGLREIPDEDFSVEIVYQFLSENPVDVDSISKYFHWSDNCYTRNLIHKNDRFEVMAICWESGQVSRVHNHWNQKCWMTVPVGHLKGQNFAVEDIAEDRVTANFAKRIPSRFRTASPQKLNWRNRSIRF